MLSSTRFFFSIDPGISNIGISVLAGGKFYLNNIYLTTGKKLKSKNFLGVTDTGIQLGEKLENEYLKNSICESIEFFIEKQPVYKNKSLSKYEHVIGNAISYLKGRYEINNYKSYTVNKYKGEFEIDVFNERLRNKEKSSEIFDNIPAHLKSFILVNGELTHDMCDSFILLIYGLKKYFKINETNNFYYVLEKIINIVNKD